MMRGLDATATPAPKSGFEGLELSRGPDGFRRGVLSLRKEDGRRIRCLLTAPAESSRGLLVVLPGLGRTIRHSCAVAFAAAQHGYASLRFDPTDHSGDSDGEIVDGTLSGVAADLRFVCESVREWGWATPIFVAASSSLARAAIRTAARGLPADGLVLTFPVVHLDRTLQAVSGEDLFTAYREQRIQPADPVQILTHQMSGRFLADALEADYVGLDATRADLRETRMPVAAIVAENDDWIAVDDVLLALEPERPERHVFVLENADHDSYSFGFIRAITQSTMEAISRMSGDTAFDRDRYDVTFSVLSSAIRTEKQILNQARESWSDDE